MTKLLDVLIKPRGDGDREVEVDIFNDAMPPDWHSSVEEMAAWEAMQGPDALDHRLIAWHNGIGIGAGRIGYDPNHVLNRFEIDIAVRPAFQLRGIGRELNQRLESFARSSGAREIEASVRATMLDPIQSWLEQEGYKETSRMRESELDLSKLPADLDRQVTECARKAGVRLTTLSDESDAESRKKLWRLKVLTGRDIPFDVAHEDQPFESFESMLESALIIPDALVIACEGEHYVGFSILGKQGQDRAVTWATGVDPQVRGRGLARAMKLQAASIGRRMGFRALRTFNHSNNPAMLAVNRSVGYQALPEIVFLLKQVGAVTD